MGPRTVTFFSGKTVCACLWLCLKWASTFGNPVPAMIRPLFYLGQNALYVFLYFNPCLYCSGWVTMCARVFGPSSKTARKTLVNNAISSLSLSPSLSFKRWRIMPSIWGIKRLCAIFHTDLKAEWVWRGSSSSGKLGLGTVFHSNVEKYCVHGFA